MSEWGRVIFYYDYELTDTSSVSAKNVRGLVSKAYKNIGVEGIITHAYSGIRYFLKRFNHKYSDYHMSLDNIHRLSDWEALNTVFDVFFEEEYVHLGVNDVRNVLDRWQDYKPESEQLKDELFNCEGTFGWLYMSFTGNARDGYVLKYGYEYQGEMVGVARALLLWNQRNEGVSDITQEAVQFFNEKAELVLDIDEWIGIEEKGEKLVADLINDLQHGDEADENNASANNVKNNIKFDGEATIDELGLSARSFNCLMRAGINTVAKLRMKTDDELKALRNLSEKCFLEIKESLRRIDEDTQGNVNS